MNAWSPLPNAPLIDWVLESLRTDPEKWRASYDATNYMTCTTTWDEAWDAARSEAWDAARSEAWRATRNESLKTGRTMAQSAVLALVVYDDCDQYLDMSYEQLLTYAVLSERPQAILLLPLKWIQEHECLVTTT